MKIDQPQGVPTPVFAALRELVRVARECVSLTLLTWPIRSGERLLFDSGLYSTLSKKSLHELLLDGLQDLDAQLGPAYHGLIKQALKSLKAERSTPALSFAEISDLLDKQVPDWSHDFIVERNALHTTPLYQIHAAVDQEGQRWLFKMIKPKARARLLASVAALREIEVVLKTFPVVPQLSGLIQKVEGARRSLQQEVDLTLERRTLLRLKKTLDGDTQSALRFPRSHERISNENILVFERLEGFPMNLDATDWKEIATTRRFDWTLQPIQASVLKAFEMGLVNNGDDTEKLVMMTDGSVGVRYGWNMRQSDARDRRHAATLIRTLYDRHLTESRVNDKAPTFVELAESTFANSRGLGVDLPLGFVDIAKSLQSLEGVGRPLLLKKAAPQNAAFGFPVRTSSQETALHTPIVRARRLHGR